MITQLERLEQRDPTLTPLLARIVTEAGHRLASPAPAQEAPKPAAPCEASDTVRYVLALWADGLEDQLTDYLASLEENRGGRQ